MICTENLLEQKNNVKRTFCNALPISFKYLQYKVTRTSGSSPEEIFLDFEAFFSFMTTEWGVNPELCSF